MSDISACYAVYRYPSSLSLTWLPRPQSIDRSRHWHEPDRAARVLVNPENVTKGAHRKAAPFIDWCACEEGISSSSVEGTTRLLFP